VNSTAVTAVSAPTRLPRLACPATIPPPASSLAASSVSDSSEDMYADRGFDIANVFP